MKSTVPLLTVRTTPCPTCGTIDCRVDYLREKLRRKTIRDERGWLVAISLTDFEYDVIPNALITCAVIASCRR